jgi:hypothetical protein
MNDPRPTRAPLLAQPWAAGVAGWIVVFGAAIAELVGGIVTNHMSTAITLPVLAFPAVVAFGFAVAQWWQVRSSAGEPSSWWHMAGVAAAVVTWLIWPTTPGVLAGAAGSAQAACNVLPTTATSDCLRRAAQALDNHSLAWWFTGALILILALLARRSRIAAWAAIPVAFAGCDLANHFLEQLLLYYNLSG